MKPKTKLDHLVLKLSSSLPPITDKQRQWGFDTCFTSYVYRTKTKNTCFDCMTEWNISYDDTCPCCGKKLTDLGTKERHVNERTYMTIITTHKGFQVVRHFQLDKNVKIGRKPDLLCGEIIQHWISPKGEYTVMTREINCFGFNLTWRFNTDLSIKKAQDRNYIYGPIYPRKSILPIIRRNGFKRNFHKLHPAYLFTTVLSDHCFETLLKTKQFKLLFEYPYKNNKIKQYWSQIKICIRNNYLIKDPIVWFDHLELLYSFEKDIFSPKYICSPTIEKDHAKLSAKRTKIRRLMEIQERKAKAASENTKYRRRRKKYFGLEIAEDDISIRVLKSVNEFIDEGEELEHYVYANYYYSDPDRLIMSARKKDKRLETIEVSLKQMKLVQCRGKLNQDSKYHNKIVDMVNNNIDLIRKIKLNETNKLKEYETT